MRLALLLLHVVLGASLSAQHCGYDFASIIVVHPHAIGDTAVIEGLRITLLDSTNLPVTNYGKPRNLFQRNTDPEACGQGPHGSFHGRPCAFPFAQDNYVLVIPTGFHTGTMRLLIQDECDDGPSNKNRSRGSGTGRPIRYEQQMVTLIAFDNHTLCGRYDDVIHSDLQDQPKYQPVDVQLRSR